MVCSVCGGKGYYLESVFEPCLLCGGTGYWQNIQCTCNGGGTYELETVPCPYC